MQNSPSILSNFTGHWFHSGSVSAKSVCSEKKATPNFISNRAIEYHGCGHGSLMHFIWHEKSCSTTSRPRLTWASSSNTSSISVLHFFIFFLRVWSASFLSHLPNHLQPSSSSQIQPRYSSH